MRPPDHGEPRSLLYAQLATLERAGVPARRALQGLTTETSPALRAAIAATLKQLDRGRPLAEAGRSGGLFLPWEAQLVGAGSEAGQLAAVYKNLARHHERAALRARQLKSRMVLPAAVLTLALFISPLPALVRGDLDGSGYAGRTLLPLALLLVSLSLLRAGWRRAMARDQAPPGYALLRALPGLGPLLRRLEQQRGLSILGLLLAGGLPAARALTVTAATLRDPQLRAGCQRAAASAGRGGSAAAAIDQAGLCPDAGGRALLHSSEAAGRLDDSLARVAATLEHELGLQLDLVAEWLPRLLYFGLLLPFVL